MPVRVFEAEPAAAEVDPPRHARLDHPLQRPVHGRTADRLVGSPDEIDEVIGAEVPLLAEEDADDEVALARPPAAGRAQLLDELGSRLHLGRTQPQTLNDDPQPQVDFAFGFLMVKPPPIVLSTKSTSAPCR